MTLTQRLHSIVGGLAVCGLISGLVPLEAHGHAPDADGQRRDDPREQPPPECEGECEEPCEECEDSDHPHDTPPPKTYGEEIDHLVIGYRFYTAPAKARKRLAKKREWLAEVDWWVGRINDECASHGLHIDAVVEDQKDDTDKLVNHLADIEAMIADLEAQIARSGSRRERKALQDRKDKLEGNLAKFERAAEQAERAKQAGKPPPRPRPFQSILFFTTEKAAAKVGPNPHQWIVGHDALRKKLAGHRSPRVFHFALFDDVYFKGRKSGWGPGAFGPPNLMATQYAGKPGAPKSMKHEVGHLFGLQDYTGGIMDKPYGDPSAWSASWCPEIIAHLK